LVADSAAALFLVVDSAGALFLVVDSAAAVFLVGAPARSATSGRSVGRPAVDSAAALFLVVDSAGALFLVVDSVAVVFLVGVLAAALFLAGARFEGAPTGSSGAPVVGPSIGAGLVGSLIRHAPRDSVTVSPGASRWFHIGKHSPAA
jgi:hypothetical protein